MYIVVAEVTQLLNVEWLKNQTLLTVRVKIVRKAWEYEWSSAKDHVKERTKALIKLSTHKDIKDGKQWQEHLQEDDPELTENIRIKTDRGLVVGRDKRN